MSKTFIKVGLFIFVLIFITNSQSSFAMTTDLSIVNDQSKFNIINLDTVQKPVTEAKNDTKPASKQIKTKLVKKHKKAPKLQKYVIAPGDNLTEIAKLHKTSVERLFSKNTKITNPDSINPGETIIIPAATEKLVIRNVVTAPTPVLTDATISSQPATQNLAPASYTSNTSPRGSSAGNTYTAGYCTWYVKNRRPDLPNMLGDAGAWVYSAAAQGIPTGSTPRAGAVGQQGGHVVYVEKVNGNGTVSISEMNYGGGLFVVNYRTVPASNFTYIY